MNFKIVAVLKKKNEDIKIYLNSKKRYRHTLSNDGKFELTLRKGITATLFHELVHASVDLETSKKRRLITTGIVKLMDDLNEQNTIAGIDNENESQGPNPICENGYLLARGRPLRISHHGLALHSNAVLTPLDKMLMLNEVSPETAKKFVETELPSLSEEMSFDYKGFGNYALTPWRLHVILERKI